jgi:hypothetical protein
VGPLPEGRRWKGGAGSIAGGGRARGIAGTKGPRAVPARHYVQFRRHREHSVFPLGKLIGERCIENYFGPQGEHIVHPLEQQVADCLIQKILFLLQALSNTYKKRVYRKNTSFLAFNFFIYIVTARL